MKPIGSGIDSQHDKIPLSKICKSLFRLQKKFVISGKICYIPNIMLTARCFEHKKSNPGEQDETFVL